MTQEEKQLLLKDLCARLPYGAFVFIRKPFGCVMSETEEEKLTGTTLQEFIENDDMHVFPYLRPMSSMTEEEFKEYDNETDLDVKDSAETLRENLKAETRVRVSKWYHGSDWLNAHHFDYRGLIEKGLALEAPEDMYKTE